MNDLGALETRRHGLVEGVVVAKCDGNHVHEVERKRTWTLFKLPDGKLRCWACYLAEELLAEVSTDPP